MRSRTAIWFECKVRYTKTMEDGTQKKVAETYAVDALSFSEAENRIMEEMSHFVSGEIEIANLKVAQYREVFFADNDLADKWYKGRLAFFTTDEKTDKQKKTLVNYLINATSFNSALKSVDEIMSGTMIDYKTCNVSETQVMNVFEYKSTQKKSE